MFSLLLRAQKSPVHPHKTAVIKTQTPLKEVSVFPLDIPNISEAQLLLYFTKHAKKNKSSRRSPKICLNIVPEQDMRNDHEIRQICFFYYFLKQSNSKSHLMKSYGYWHSTKAKKKKNGGVVNVLGDTRHKKCCKRDIQFLEYGIQQLIWTGMQTRRSHRKLS